jgi:Right handed beta helix region
MIRTIFLAAGLAFAATLSAAPAQAQAARTFVSAAGSDSNNCINVATPCRHLATAFAATAPDGEIYVLDPANYGSLTITHGVSIQGHGWASIAPVANSAAITIDVGPNDKINIIGVVLDGTAIANTDGIRFNFGGTLNVRDSVIRNFSASGINFAPNPSALIQLFVSNTLISDNGLDGIFINPYSTGTTTGVLDHVQLDNNARFGLSVATGGTNHVIRLTFADSVSTNNGAGIIVAEAIGTIMVRNSTIANNVGLGLSAVGPGAAIFVTQSTITGNSTAWDVTFPGVVLSYGDNNIDGNGSANTEPPNPLSYK